MKGKPDLAIIVADKAMGKKPKGDDDDDGEDKMFESMAADLIKGVQSGDKALIASILEAVSHGMS